MVTWPMILDGHVTRFLETRSRCSTRTWRSSVADSDIGKIPKRLIANQGSPIGWSRDQWSRVVTWPAFWKLGQGAARDCGISRSPIVISEKFQKRLIANQGSPIGWSRDQWSRVVTGPAFWKLGQGAAQKYGVSDVCGFCNIVTLLSLIRIIKQQILMQKLLRSSKLSCSKPLITLLKQQISNCCTVKKSHRAMLCIAYAQSAYDYARLMWIAVGKQCALPGAIFSLYNNLIFAVLEVWWGAYYNSALNFEEVFALMRVKGIVLVSRLLSLLLFALKSVHALKTGSCCLILTSNELFLTIMIPNHGTKLVMIGRELRPIHWFMFVRELQLYLVRLIGCCDKLLLIATKRAELPLLSSILKKVNCTSWTQRTINQRAAGEVTAGDWHDNALYLVCECDCQDLDHGSSS